MLTVRPNSNSFKAVEQKAIKQALSDALGLSTAVSLIINFSLDELIDDLPAFHKKLHGLFGSPATEILERQIVKQIFSQLDETYVAPRSFNFVSAVEQARKIFGRKVEPISVTSSLRTT
jgi:hypothetical protein